MKKILNIIIFILIFNSLYSEGSFSVGVYGNINSYFRDQSSKSVTTNADWNIQDPSGYFELKLSGLNFEGFNIWSKLGANIEFMKGNLYQMNNMFSFSGVTNSDPKIDNFIFHQWEAHIQKTFDTKALGKGSKITIALFRSQDRTDVGQPYIDFFGDVFDGDTKTGFQWDGYNLLGFNTKGFIIDYRSDMKDIEASDKYAYGFGLRINRDVFKSTVFNVNLGFTGGGNQYYKPSPVQGYGINLDFINKYYYNIMGLDISINGDHPLIGSYYLFNGFGRSYAPEEFPFDNTPFVSFLGNSNSLIWDMELKWNKKFEFGTLDFGTLYAGIYTHLRQPNYRTYMGGSGDLKYIESLNISYHFPVKAITLTSLFEYKHDYGMSNNYHLWEVGTITDPSVEFKKHVDLNIMFKNGFSFNIAWDNQAGQNYLGSFEPDGINFITLVTRGETSLGKISPQLKIVAPGDTNKQVISTGIEILVNLTSWLQFYSRFGYVQSAGFWKTTDGYLNWWNAYLQFQFFSGNNSKMSIELGNGGDTGDGLVSDVDLIKGKTFDKKVYFKWEYWM